MLNTALSGSTRRFIAVVGMLILSLMTLPSFCQSADEAEAAVAAEQPAVELVEESEAPSSFDAIMAKVRKGKKTGVALILLSIVGIAFALERAANLRRSAIVPRGMADRANRMWREGDYNGILSFAEKDKSILAKVIVSLVEHRDIPSAEVETIASDIASRGLRKQLQKAYPLNVIGNLAPLLGLLGTVFGMIASFETVAAAGSLGDATILADGISQALVTTAMGLIVALPMLALYHFFKVRTTNYALALEEQASELISRWFIRRQLATSTEAPAQAESAPPSAANTEEEKKPVEVGNEN